MRLQLLAGLCAPLMMALPAVAQTMYHSPDTAQNHCPSDAVVWLNSRTGVYHFAGERWYGHTQDGGYVCERQAEGAGDRASRNGQ